LVNLESKGRPDSSGKREELHRKTELWLCDAKMHTSKTVKTRNKHRGSSFEDFLKQEGLLENVQAAAFNRGRDSGSISISAGATVSHRELKLS
jgi:hypothetical protein